MKRVTRKGNGAPSLPLAGLPSSVPGVTLSRLRWASLKAAGSAARASRLVEMAFAVAGLATLSLGVGMGLPFAIERV
jgi:hypothetical protein